MTPGTTSSVVNSYAATFDFAFVSALSSVDFPTLGQAYEDDRPVSRLLYVESDGAPRAPRLLLFLLHLELGELRPEDSDVALGVLVDLRLEHVLLDLLDLLRNAQLEPLPSDPTSWTDEGE